jgi:regulation of enolase protein 1 (concanavalin A-like superfamily)
MIHFSHILLTALAAIALVPTMSTAIPPFFTSLNTQQTPPTTFPYTLSVAPKTDLWVKPLSFAPQPPNSPAATIAANQPSFVQSIPLKHFRSATTTVSFVPKVLYDQAGVVFLFPEQNGKRTKWIKAGLEYYEGSAKRGVVVTPGGGVSSDWSISPHPSSGGERVQAKVELIREDALTTSSLFIKINGETVREVTWVFGDGQNGNQEVLVGFYGARPGENGSNGPLEIKVDEWILVSE